MNPVLFVGAGPGAPDLITLRGRAAIEQADVIVYAGSLVSPEHLRWARSGCACHDSAGMDLEQTHAVLAAAARAGQRAVRLHTGDPALFGAIAEQMRRLDADGIPYEVVPGVSSLFAAAAACKAELTLPGISQTVIISRRAGRTGVPAGQDLPALASHGATLALFLSVQDIDGVVSDLRAGGYADDTPVAVVEQASWPGERVLRGTLAGIAAQVRAAGIVRQAIILVGRALAGDGEASRLYDRAFTHGWRSAGDGPVPAAAPIAAPLAALPSPLAFWGLTAPGCALAARLARDLGGTALVSRRFPQAGAETFDPQEFKACFAQRWSAFAGHVCVMAAGICVRASAGLLRDKTSDPAVLVCDEEGRHAVPILSGHLGGANRLAEAVAGVLGGRAVITTATDVQGRPAFDQIAADQGWRVLDRDRIKVISDLVLRGRPLAVALPRPVFDRTCARQANLLWCADPAHPPVGSEGLVVLDAPEGFTTPLPALRLASRPLAVGLGCNRGVGAAALGAALDGVLGAAGLSPGAVRLLASVEAKRDEAGLVDLARTRGLELRCFAAEVLAAVEVPNPSAAPLAAVGTPSVAEAAARLAGGGRLLLPKTVVDREITVAVALIAEGERT